MLSRESEEVVLGNVESYVRQCCCKAVELQGDLLAPGVWLEKELEKVDLLYWTRVLVLVGVIAGLCAPWTLGQERGTAFSNPPTNLKVLKVDSLEELRPIMQDFGRSLGVACAFCHNREDWAEDTPHKETARKMIEMIRTINAEVFTWERAPSATCNMCHNGNVYPQFNPPRE